MRRKEGGGYNQKYKNSLWLSSYINTVWTEVICVTNVSIHLPLRFLPLCLPLRLSVFLLIRSVCLSTPVYLSFSYLTLWWGRQQHFILFMNNNQVIIAFRLVFYVNQISETLSQKYIYHWDEYCKSFLKGWCFLFKVFFVLIFDVSVTQTPQLHQHYTHAHTGWSP